MARFSKTISTTEVSGKAQTFSFRLKDGKSEIFADSTYDRQWHETIIFAEIANIDPNEITTIIQYDFNNNIISEKSIETLRRPKVDPIMAAKIEARNMNLSKMHHIGRKLHHASV